VSTLSDRFTRYLSPSKYDSDRGSLRILCGQLARMGQPNSIVDHSIQTEAVGTTYAALPVASPLIDCARIVGDNTTGTSLTFRRVGTTVLFAFASGARVELPVVASPTEWEVKRTDDSNTQVTFKYLRYAMI
jgi:hypothetical protein